MRKKKILGEYLKTLGSSKGMEKVTSVLRP